jgi:hypothetical protein
VRRSRVMLHTLVWVLMLVPDAACCSGFLVRSRYIRRVMIWSCGLAFFVIALCLRRCGVMLGSVRLVVVCSRIV